MVRGDDGGNDVTGSGVGKHYHWKYKMVGVPLHGEGTTTEYVPNERMVAKTKGGIASTLTYSFAPHEGGTELEVDSGYTIPVPVLGKLAEKLVLKRNQREPEGISSQTPRFSTHRVRNAYSLARALWSSLSMLDSMRAPRPNILASMEKLSVRRQ